jgi:hypothetical protein
MREDVRTWGATVQEKINKDTAALHEDIKKTLAASSSQERTGGSGLAKPVKLVDCNVTRSKVNTWDFEDKTYTHADFKKGENGEAGAAQEWSKTRSSWRKQQLTKVGAKSIDRLLRS